MESAVVTPVLLLLVFGIMEFGFAFRDYLAAANATRDGAREASVAGSGLDADYRILRSVARASASLPDGAIEQLVIWEATGPDDSVPDACRTSGSQAGLCNVYSSTQLRLAPDNFGCDAGPPADVDIAWCPSEREVSVGSRLDYIGVYIRISHEYITGLFGDDITFEDHMILKVEPQEQ
ncbi:MAG: TadE family protein [Actinomycetota bacterium]